MYPSSRQQPSVQYLPPSTIEDYYHQWVTTTIPGYGRVIAYIADYNRRTGMVSLLVYQAPYYQQQFVQVHHSDLIGISPYFGSVPPQGGGGHTPPRPPWYPGYPGGGFWPWLYGQISSYGSTGQN
ncbi:hypothetical protein [Shouchella shacheensis]|uniref:hypothetical protein n=1 Tax=Shouchella shacheensis TaxID=1649580 RepID=UPI0007404C3A|nr:hypothetical protein [Shouchella shacheensis]